MCKTPKRRFESRPLADLQPHRQQAELFGEGSDLEIEELAADIRKHGVIQPIEITSDNTIIAGHRRVKALRLLKQTEIRCWVREDLEELGEKAIEQRLIEDNLNRRQMSRLEQARAYRRLKHLHNSRRTESDEALDGDLRDFLATRFGVSGRTLDRWEQVLDAPREIQDAIDSQTLTITQAGKIAILPGDIQARIGERIRGGENPKKVVNDYVGSVSVADSGARSEITKLVSQLNKAVSAIDKKSEASERAVLARHLPDLKKADQKIQKLVRSIEIKDARKKRKR